MCKLQLELNEHNKSDTVAEIIYNLSILCVVPTPVVITHTIYA